MLGQKLITRQIEGKRHIIASLKTKWQACRNCCEIWECKVPSINQLPFLWTPICSTVQRTTRGKFNEIEILITTDRCSPSKQHLAYESPNLCHKRESYDWMEHLKFDPDLKKECKLFAVPSCLTPMIETLRCREHFEFCMEERKSPCSEIYLHNEKQHHLSTEFKEYKKNEKNIVKENNNGKVLLFTKSSRLRTSKESSRKKASRAKEMIMEKIAVHLLAEWPNLFDSKCLVDFSRISESIFFENDVLHIKTRGLKWYKFQLYLFKWTSWLFWFDSSLQILQLTKNVEDSTIKIRWLANGKRRLLSPLLLLGRSPSLRYMDFFSILHIGETAKIEAHRLTKLVPRNSTQKRNPVMVLFTLFGLTGRNIPEFEKKPVLPSSSEPAG